MSIKASFDCAVFHLQVSTNDPYTIETFVEEFGKCLDKAAVLAASTPAISGDTDEDD